ncbi:MAG: DUF362 domain-containing protein [Thermodesulfovibrionales bacterium]
MPEVFFKGASYRYARLRSAAFEALAAVDRGAISPGSKVLVKPNILTSATPGQAVTTHPLVIKAACEYALEKGGRVQVSDSTAITSFDRKVRECGIAEALAGLPVRISELKAARGVPTGGRMGNVDLAEDALDADVIINLPKLKTHSQMVLTLAVKNLFGCVPGMKKPEWHYRIGEDTGLFAELLVRIYGILKPSINLMDAVLAMEGDGPGTGGTPRPLGVLVASGDALAMDMAVCGMLGLDPEKVPTNKAALDLGMPADFKAVGEVPEVRDFKFPAPSDLLFGPRLFHSFTRRHLTARPTSVPALCGLCGECEKICPAGAVARRRGKLEFDYDRCIRCYCCLEVCPHGAMKKEAPVLRKIFAPFLR